MICQCCTSNKGLKNPVSMARMSDKVWDEISIDFFGPLPSGEYCLVLTDDSSRYKAVKIVRSTGTDSTVGRLDEVHTVLGIPSVIRTDNGPPFNGRAFRKYCDSLGIKHRKITPLWPRANGKCERFMQQLSKVVTGSHIAKKNWREELNVFLRSYNCTPHSVTGVAPVELMFNRTNFTKLPSYDLKSQDWDNNLKKAMDNELKSNEIVEKRFGPKVSHEIKFKLGDCVLLKQQKINKLTSKYESIPYKVVEIKGTMITAKNDVKEVTRNYSFFKKVVVGNNGFESQSVKSEICEDLPPLALIEESDMIYDKFTVGDLEEAKLNVTLDDGSVNDGTLGDKFHSLAEGDVNKSDSKSGNQLIDDTMVITDGRANLQRRCKKQTSYSEARQYMKK